MGNLIGPQSFRANEAPGYPTAYTIMLVGYCLSLALLAVYAWICHRDNRQKELDEAAWRQQGGDAGDVAEEWKDLTDKQVRGGPPTRLVVSCQCHAL